ncbi:MAG: hypothetical protein KAX10_05205 [Candidatus Lokiarchaeota archaeon]|nr:hypothetical protein [Candidatus Lokiarchaeota archaeon]
MKKEEDFKKTLCWNCKLEIIDKSIQRCPECNAILYPNSFINWTKSWLLFLLILCIVPISIALIFIYFL